MAWLYRFSIRRPRLVITLGLLITLAIAPGNLRLKLRTDGHALVPDHAPEIHIDRTIRDKFANEDPIVILIQSDHPDGIYNVHTLRLVQELTRAVTEIEGVRAANVSSLATEHTDRVWPGTLNFRRFLEPMPETAEELQRLRKDLREIKIYLGTVVSRDGQSAAVLVGVPAGASRIDFYATVRDLVADLADGTERIDVIGAPVAEALLGHHILEDLGVPTVLLGHSTFSDSAETADSAPTGFYGWRVWLGRHIGLVPIAIGIMAIVFLIGFRSFTAAVLPLIEVGACLVTVFGLMGWCGIPVYLTIAVLPVILTAMGVADEVHIFSRYTKLLRERLKDSNNADPRANDTEQQASARAISSGAPTVPDAVSLGRLTQKQPALEGGGHLDVLHKTMHEMWRPVVKTSVTTSVAFLSFAMSPIGAVQAFGLFTAVGVLFCMIWSLTVIPAMLAVIAPRRFVSASSSAGSRFVSLGWLARLGAGVVRYRVVVLVLSVGCMAAIPWGLRRVIVQDSWIDGFAPGSMFSRATHLFNDQFLGMHILLVAVDAGEGECLEGELGAQALDRKHIRLPGDLVEDPQTLVSQKIELMAVEPTEIARVGQPTRYIHRKWSSWIVSAARDGNEILITGVPYRGSPRTALRLAAEAKASFVLTPQRLKQPDVLRRIAALEEFISGRKEDAVGGVLGPAAFLSTTNFMVKARDEEYRRIPEKRERIEWLWRQYERIRGKERHHELLDEEYSRGLITVFLKNANFVATQRLMAGIREYERRHLIPHGIQLAFGGDVAVSQALIEAVVTTQVRSLVGSLIGIFVVTSVLGRSLIWGVLSVLPSALAILINFALMGFLAVPLGVATSMFSGMTLGIGVDYAIHLLERYRLLRQEGMDATRAAAAAVAEAGPAIFMDALAVALGFGVLVLSQVPANNRLGGLLVVSICGCFLATVLILPALLRLLRPHVPPLQNADSPSTVTEGS